MRTKHRPERLCVACRTMRPKDELLRIVKREDGTVVPDPTGKMQGRGAYLCAEADCIDEAFRAHRLEQSLRTRMPEGIREALEELRREQEEQKGTAETAKVRKVRGISIDRLKRG